MHAERDELSSKPIAVFDAGHWGHIGVYTLTLDVVGESHYRSFCNILVQHQRALDLSGAHSVPRHIEHIIDPAGDAQIAVFVPHCAIASEIIAGVSGEIGVDHPLVIAKNGADLGRPGSLDHQITRSSRFNLVALLVEQCGLHTKEGEAGEARLQRVRSR